MLDLMEEKEQSRKEVDLVAGLKIKTVSKPDRVINYWLKEKYIVVCIILFGLIFNISMILGPIYQGKLIDSMVAGDKLTATIKLVIAFISFIVMTQVFRYFKRYYIRRFANSTSATMRLMIYNNIMHKDITQLRQEHTGDLMTKAISDVELCVEGMRKFTTEIFDTGVLMLSYIITLLVYDVKITIYSITFVPIAMFLAKKLKSIIYKYSTSYRKKSSEVTGITYDLIDNAMFYRVNGVDKDNLSKYGDHLIDLQNKAVKANILENSMQPIYNVIAMAGSLIVIYMCGTKVINGVWTIGMFSTYIAIFIAMAGKASKASKLFNSIQKSQISWKRIKPYLSEYKSNQKSGNMNTLMTKVTVHDFSFRYQKDANPIVSNINFEGKQGEIIGITGPIASGKSTLGMALTGMYQYLGSIRIDGKELKDYSEYERSQMIAFLGHKPELLSDTIYNNITLGQQIDITEVLKDVCFDADLNSMPEGYHTVVGNGGIRLSGGQQARIALARALLHKRKIIILDDPFSAVDMQTERIIIEKLREHYKESLIILISHRLAIFKDIDRILIIHNDKEVEVGTHVELMSASSLYSSIYQLQYAEGGVINES